MKMTDIAEQARVKLPANCTYADPDSVTFDERCRLYRVVGWELPAPEDISSGYDRDIDVGVRYNNRQLIGLGRMAVAYRDCYEEWNGFLYALSVDPQHQGRGVGSAIVKERVRIADELGLEVLFMPPLLPTNTLPSLYAQLGFVPDAEGNLIRLRAASPRLA